MVAALLVSLLLGALFAAAIAVASYRLRLLTLGGSLAQFAAGWLLFGLGGWQWAVPIVLFFILSNAVSRLTRAEVRPGSVLFAKGGTRDELQVAANGGLASVLVLPWFLTGTEVLYVAYLGAVGAAAADTWATDVGMTSVRPPRSLLTLRAVPPGQSGGVTPRGLMAAALGGLGIALSGSLWVEAQVPAVIAVAGAAFIASLVDSLLGATLQLQYRCTVCGSQTERARHCGAEARRTRGRFWFTNDTVNLIASTTGGAVSTVAYLALA